MRRCVVATVAAGLLIGAPSVHANSVIGSNAGTTYEEACFGWTDDEGAEQSVVELCGFRLERSGSSAASVAVTRTLATCDHDGRNCTTAGTQTYSGPATPTELRMDAVAGVAFFNIVLHGDVGQDRCEITFSALATDSYTIGDPIPRLDATISAREPSAGVRHDTRTFEARAWRSSFTEIEISLSNDESLWRDASGSGSVCSWMTDVVSDSGYITSTTDAETSRSVRSPWGLPLIP